MDGLRRLPLVSPLLLLTAACAGGEGGRSSLEAPPWAATGPEVRIGSVDDPAYAFGAVQSLALGSDGSVYSLHRNEAWVRKWTPDGHPADSIGGPGEGPGEFVQPFFMGVFGDSLWVVDLRSYRASYFGPDGSFLGSVAPKLDLGDRERNPPRPQRPLRDGTWFGAVPAWSDGIARGTIKEIPYVHMDAAGTVLDTTWVQSMRTTDVLALLRKDGPGGTYSSQPFGDAPIFGVLDDGGMVVVDRRVPVQAEGAALGITRITAAGDTLWRKALPYAPVLLPPERVDSAAAAQAERMIGFMGRVQQGITQAGLEKELRAAMYAPRFVPFVTGMMLAEDGSIWLQRSDPTADGTEWWVLDAEGEPLGRALLPTGLRVLRIEGDDVWGVEQDDLDVSYIVRYRVHRGPA